MSQRSGLATCWLQTAELPPLCGQAEGLGTSIPHFRDTEPPASLGVPIGAPPVPQCHSCKGRIVESSLILRSRPKELGEGDPPGAAQLHRGLGDLPHTPNLV